MERVWDKPLALSFFSLLVWPYLNIHFVPNADTKRCIAQRRIKFSFSFALLVHHPVLKDWQDNWLQLEVDKTALTTLDFLAQKFKLKSCYADA